ncbi:MAG: hypothetical protein V1744_06065 [Candidatus Altiarchaeota archaeon]
MKWTDCMKEKVKAIRPDNERAKAMTELAVKRLNSIARRRQTEDPEFIVEDYYESIKELTTALLFSRGYKSYSHECLISFLQEFHPEFGKDELELINQMREIRNDIQYRGEPLASGFLKRREADIKGVIDKLAKTVEKTVRG